MQSMLEYRSGIADRRHPWLASGLAAAIGLLWGIAPLSVLFATGDSAGSPRVIFVTLWCAVVGLAAGVWTLWTRRRNGGAETPIGLVGTYYLAIFVFWIGLSFLEGIDWFRSGTTVVSRTVLHSFVNENLGVLLHLLGYGTVMGLIAVPICYVCREQVWKTYIRG